MGTNFIDAMSPHRRSAEEVTPPKAKYPKFSFRCSHGTAAAVCKVVGGIPEYSDGDRLVEAERGINKRFHRLRRAVVVCIRGYMVMLRNKHLECASGALLAVDLFDRFMYTEAVDDTDRLRAIAGAVVLVACKMLHVFQPDKDGILGLVESENVGWDHVLKAEMQLLRGLRFKMSLPTAEEAVHVLYENEAPSLQTLAVRLLELFADSDEYPAWLPSELAAAAVVLAGGESATANAKLVQSIREHGAKKSADDQAEILCEHSSFFMRPVFEGI